MNRNDIEKKAADLIQSSGVEGIYPVPLIPIAEHLGYTIKEFEPNTPEKARISGVVHYSKANILVNSQEPYVRRRFTVAHEIGHIQLHGEKNNYIDYRNANATSSEHESDANKFAAALLMPEDKFKAVVHASNSYLTVAKFFDVGADAARYRAINLKCELSK